MNPKLEAVIAATGWTLVHSLWQGLLIALVVGLLLVILRQNNPVLRHGVLVVGLLLFPVAAITTFVKCWDPYGYVTAASLSTGLATPKMAPGFFEQVVVPCFPYLVALWLLGSMLLVLRSSIGYVLAQYLLKRDATPADEHWQARLQNLLDLMDIRRGVRIVLSNTIDVPMVIGHAKPVILLPISVLSGLPYAEVEAILLHELAHIKRNDYLVNLLQTCLEAVFFYHPGCWWMSARLRSERELCCDDLAIAVTRDPLTFAKALAHLEEVHMKIPFGAMAANGRGALFNRIERLMRPTVRTGPREALTTATLVLVTGLLFFHFTGLAIATPGQEAKAATQQLASVSSEQDKQVKLQQQHEAEKKREQAAYQAQLQSEMDALAAHEDQLRASEAAIVQAQSALLHQEKHAVEAARAVAEADVQRVVEEKEDLEKAKAQLKDEVQKNKSELEQLEHDLRTNKTPPKAYAAQLDQVAKLNRMVAELKAKNQELAQQLRELKEAREVDSTRDGQPHPAAVVAPVPQTTADALAPMAPAPASPLSERAQPALTPKPVLQVRPEPVVLAPVATPKPAAVPRIAVAVQKPAHVQRPQTKGSAAAAPMAQPAPQPPRQ